MKNLKSIPTLCSKCKWSLTNRCNYDEDYWGEEFSPDILCFEPLNNPSYPSSKKVTGKWMNVLESMTKLELVFTREKKIYDDLTDTISMLSKLIKLLNSFKGNCQELQMAYQKIPKTFINGELYFN